MYRYANCPVCKGQVFLDFLICEDYTVSHEKFQIVSCKSCNFKLTNPIPDSSKLGEYYKSEDYISHSNTNKGLISKLYHLVRAYTLKRKIRLISRHVSRGTILDYGCGTGMFLKSCYDANWVSFGIEPDSGARSIAAKLGLRTYAHKKELEDSNPGVAFDAITLWHVLEHVTDLEPTLEFLKMRLKKNGVLIIAVPNYTSFDATLYKEFWAAYDVPRHLYHFEINTISQLLSAFDFKLIDAVPMKFDSFYVSMLSEKYKSGSVNYARAFLSGLRSNLKAKSAKDYSSVVYIFKHA